MQGLRNRLGGEDGVALITVLGASMVMALLVTAILGYGLQGQEQAKDDEEWNGALSAAEAGIDDFLYRINRDNAYWQEADPDWDGGGGVPDPANPALAGLTDVRGDADHVDGEFTYAVNASEIETQGNVALTVTGAVGDEARTIRATLRREGFLNYLYFTDFETTDPASYPESASNGRDQRWAANNCVRYRWANPTRHSGCEDIFWYGNADKRDVVDGPFHTNDRIAVSGNPKWTDEATSSDPSRNGPAIFRSPSTSRPVFERGLNFRAPIPMPPSNDQIKAKADPAIGGRGCLYYGETFLQFRSNGGVKIKSNRSASPSRCPVDATLSRVPEDWVVYVADMPAGQTCLSRPPVPYDLRNTFPSYDECDGDAFVEGTLDGRVTVAAENNIIVSDDVMYKGGRGAGSDDMLGLVANNFVEIMHPIKICRRNNGSEYACNLNYLNGQPFRDVHLDAAILSVRHSFRVQLHEYGEPLRNLDVHGAIAQKFRGPVGTFSGSTKSTGYTKVYGYDDRLQYLSPPYFLDPVKSAWGIAEWSEERSP